AFTISEFSGGAFVPKPCVDVELLVSEIAEISTAFPGASKDEFVFVSATWCSEFVADEMDEILVPSRTNELVPPVTGKLFAIRFVAASVLLLTAREFVPELLAGVFVPFAIFNSVEFVI